jgi:hypothetical protein
VFAAAQPSLRSPNLQAATTSNQPDGDARAGATAPIQPPPSFTTARAASDRDSPGLRLYKRSELIKKKHEKLRENMEREEEQRLHRVPVAPPQHFDAVKYQQRLLERARNIDTARKKQQEKAQLQAQGLVHVLALLETK